MNTRQNLRKLYLINSVFPEITGNDLFFAEQIRHAVEATLEEPVDAGDETGFECFTRALMTLREQWQAGNGGLFEFWDAARNQGFSPLWARSELVSRLKRIAANPEATLLVANLAEAVRPRSGRWTPRARADYDEAVALIRDLARRWSTRSARLTLIVY